VQDSLCIERQVIFLDRTTELKLSIMRWKYIHFCRDNEKLLPRKAILLVRVLGTETDLCWLPDDNGSCCWMWWSIVVFWCWM